MHMRQNTYAFCELESLFGEARNLAKLAHWVKLACLYGTTLIYACLLRRSYDMAKL